MIEGCITLAIISILAGTAAPSFFESNTKRTLDGSAGEMATDLYLGRSEAVARQQGVRVSFYAVPSGACMVIHTGSTADCCCDAGGAAHCVNEATLIKSNYFAASRGVGVVANVAMRFDHTNGTVSPASTVRMTANNGSEVRHVVSIMGRVRSCSPGGGSAKGYKAC